MVDESAGRRQSYIEDCQVCCKPNCFVSSTIRTSGNLWLRQNWN